MLAVLLAVRVDDKLVPSTLQPLRYDAYDMPSVCKSCLTSAISDHNYSHQQLIEFEQRTSCNRAHSPLTSLRYRQSVLLAQPLVCDVFIDPRNLAFALDRADGL